MYATEKSIMQQFEYIAVTNVGWLEQYATNQRNFMQSAVPI